MGASTLSMGRIDQPADSFVQGFVMAWWRSRRGGRGRRRRPAAALGNEKWWAALERRWTVPVVMAEGAGTGNVREQLFKVLLGRPCREPPSDRQLEAAVRGVESRQVPGGRGVPACVVRHAVGQFVVVVTGMSANMDDCRWSRAVCASCLGEGPERLVSLPAAFTGVVGMMREEELLEGVNAVGGIGADGEVGSRRGEGEGVDYGEGFETC